MSLSVKDRIKQTKTNADPDSMTEIVILKMAQGVDMSEFLAQVQREHGYTKLDKVSDLPIIGCIVLECESNLEASRGVDALNEYSEVIYAEPDYVRNIHD